MLIFSVTSLTPIAGGDGVFFIDKAMISANLETD